MEETVFYGMPSKRMKRFSIFIIILAICVSLFTGCGYNKQIVDFNYSFKYALVSHPDGEELVQIKSWNNYENSDMVQYIDMEGNPHLTHSSRVILMKDPPIDNK